MSQVITGVTAREVTSRSTGKTFTIYDVMFQDGTKGTANRQIAEKIMPLIGTPVVAKITTKQNGQYTNYYVDDVSPDSGGSVIAPTVFPAPTTSSSSVSVTTSPVPSGGPSERDMQIWRQVATKVSAHLSKSYGDFWGNVDVLMRYYETGEHPETYDDGIPF